MQDQKRYTFPDSRIYLRQLEESDVTDEYLSWFADSEVTNFLEAKNLTRDEVVCYLREGAASGQHFVYGIIYREDDRHIGNVKLGPINRVHGTSDLVTVVGDRNFWGKGIATEAIRIGNDIAFQTFGLRKLNGGMYSDNAGSIKAYLKADWVIEAELVGHYVRNGRPQSRVVVSCFNPRYFERRGTKFVPRDKL